MFRHGSIMEDHYSPKSPFVALAASGDLPLAGNGLAEDNLERLIAFTRDGDVSNRDWATMALGMYAPETPNVIEALVAAADDEDCDVRAEALEALAARDGELARPLVERELAKAECGYGAFEAARLIAEPSLLGGLQRWRRQFRQSWWNDLVEEAVAACNPQRGSST